MKKNVVVLTGAGISAESGIPTFRDVNGLWEGFDVQEVASPQGWKNNRELVLEFYNQRRKGIRAANPNSAHTILKELEKYFNVTIITQNIDDLHERAGSSSVIHLHGEIFKARSSVDSGLVYNLLDKDIKLGDCCDKGSQLRPHIVWFGEEVPLINTAIDLVCDADILLVIGTSLVVYPAAGLVNYVKKQTPIFVVDPNVPEIYKEDLSVKHFKESATKGMEIVRKLLLDKYQQIL